MTFEGQTFESFNDAKNAIVGEESDYRWYNRLTGRQIRSPNKYKDVILYSYNHRMGYKGMSRIQKTSKGVLVILEVFDQSGYETFNNLWYAVT